ncbi:CYTH and CHAD domain-containing protein [Paralimibaculum aggregatum]|nr:CYTH and CHAD domain-containing protein [Limibaculum sp. NKW23]
MREIELKIEIAPDQAARLDGHPSVQRLAAGPAETRVLRTLYLDTPGQALARADIALRLRHDGDGWVQTAKARRGRGAGLMEAVESTVGIDAPVADPDAVPDEGLRSVILTALAGATPEVRFETAIRRTTRRLSLPRLGEVELAVDEGEIRAGERTAPLSEVEIELLSGQAAAVFEVARELFPEGGVRPSLLTKAERGGRLAAGHDPSAVAPRNAAGVALHADMTAEQGAREVLSECLEQLAANIPVVIASDDPEGPHQLRIGLRRLRSALLVFGGTLGGDRLAHLDNEARWLGHEAGRVRDLDVAHADILGPLREEMPGEPGADALAASLARKLAEARADLRQTLAGPRVWALLLDLGEYIATRGWLDPGDWEQTTRLARPLGAAAAEALDGRLARVMRRGEKIGTLEIDARHDLRKELKKLRYAVEFFAPIFPEKKVKPFVRRLKALQEIFGDLQDAAMAEEMFRAENGPGSDSVPAARAAGFVIGVRTERARRSWEAAKQLWKAFKETGPFWP